MFHENHENFNFEDCSFNAHKSKEACGRVVMFKEFGIIYSYTLESSFCGPTRGSLEGCHFTAATLLGIGRNFCSTLFDMADDVDRAKKTHQELIARFPITAPSKKGYVEDDE